MGTESIVAAAMEEFMTRPGVTETAMFGSPGLKINGKYFALLVKGKLVVKLAKERVEKLVETGTGDFFDPGHGRKMKEWVELEPKSRKACVSYMEEAADIVSAIADKSGKKVAKKAVAKKAPVKKKTKAKVKA